MNNADPDIREQIEREKSIIRWKELQRFFASGSLIYLDPSLDMVNVALCMHADDKQSIEQWLQHGSLAKVSDIQARHWFHTDAELVAVVVRPWVLVQEVREADAEV